MTTWADELNKVLDAHPIIANSDFIALALEYQCEAIVDHPDLFECYEANEMKEIGELLKDVRKLRWRWYNELRAMLEEI